MPRGKRLLIGNACYHIIARGNQKQDIFLKEVDFEKYLEIVEHYKNKYKFNLYAYCLMKNHVHLIMSVKHICDLAKIMQGLNQAYSMWFNQKYNKNGHLWEGRFKNMVIQKDKYFMDCVHYVECNPVRANIVNSLIDYPWSSYKFRALGKVSRLLNQIEIA